MRLLRLLKIEGVHGKKAILLTNINPVVIFLFRLGFWQDNG